MTSKNERSAPVEETLYRKSNTFLVGRLVESLAIDLASCVNCGSSPTRKCLSKEVCLRRLLAACQKPSFVEALKSEVAELAVSDV